MSNIAQPTLKEVVRRILACEAASRNPSDANYFAGFRICDKLSGPLGKLIGVVGFHALLSRALALASAEVPSLLALQVTPDGLLGGVDGLEAKLGPRALGDGETILVSKLLGLLMTFLGPALTLRLLHDIWPKFDDLKL